MAKTLRQRQAETGRALALNGAAWRRLRARVLADQPLCVHCERTGAVTPATEVDHVDNDPANNRRENLQGLCASHHAMKTRQDYGARAKFGCDADGRPLDPNHEWNQTS